MGIHCPSALIIIEEKKSAVFVKTARQTERVRILWVLTRRQDF